MPVWKAELSTVFEAPYPGATVLGHRQSGGPMALQKILYPEGPSIAHAFILHPPSGIAGGDLISIASQVKPGAHALLTTPGAARWYKANGQYAEQQVHITVEDDGCLEWLPSENIFFDECQARLITEIRLAPAARFLGWEVMQFGQQQSLQSTGHVWRSAWVRVDASVTIDTCLDWKELAAFSPENVHHRPAIQGTGGFPVHGTLWAYSGQPLSESDQDSCARLASFSSALRSGFTQLPSGLVVFRVLASETEVARSALIQAWALLRPWAVGRTAEPLRIWAT
ncbi:MAG: urease accessory protein [Betaproteobacteria bacterium]|nr:urease accessory protein [Betaproteobacteria bacterium]